MIESIIKVPVDDVSATKLSTRPFVPSKSIFIFEVPEDVNLPNVKLSITLLFISNVVLFIDKLNLPEIVLFKSNTVSVPSPTRFIV